MRVVLGKKRKKPIFIYYFIAFLTLFSLLLVFCDTRIRPVIKRKVRDCARTDTVYILNHTLLSEIEKLSLKYEDLAIVSKNAEGQITSIETNSTAINRFKASFALSATDALREVEQFKFSMSLGTLLGPEFLTETGPQIPFKVTSSDYVQTEIDSEFTESGINQTVHRIVLKVSVNICCYFPGYTTSVTVQTQLPLTETVIVGVVPNVFVN